MWDTPVTWSTATHMASNTDMGMVMPPATWMSNRTPAANGRTRATSGGRGADLTD